MTARPPLLFYCQHSVGIGHLMRSLALVRALSDRFDVAFVSGGAVPRRLRPTGDVKVIQLPPVGMDEQGRLASRDRRRTLPCALAERRRLLVEAYRTQRPRVIVIELFPFGRRKFRPELEPILDAARRGGPGQTLVVCSLRDFLVSRHPDHDAQVSELLDRYFHGVLVHSDPSFARLEESFNGTIAGRLPVLYTGFVHGISGVAQRTGIQARSVVVSAGGGMMGESLLRCAVDAHALMPPNLRPRLTLLAGPLLPVSTWRGLRLLTKERTGIELRRSVANLSDTLKRAAASISQCGYNTAMDLLDSRVPALVVPFGEGSEDEQLKRARRLEGLGLVRVLLPKDLTPARLAREISILPGFRPPAAGLNMDGAACTARLLNQLSGSAGTARRPGSMSMPSERIAG